MERLTQGFTIWGMVETVTDGVLYNLELYMLGMEPHWSPKGAVVLRNIISYPMDLVFFWDFDLTGHKFWDQQVLSRVQFQMLSSELES